METLKSFTDLTLNQNKEINIIATDANTKAILKNIYLNPKVDGRLDLYLDDKKVYQNVECSANQTLKLENENIIVPESSKLNMDFKSTTQSALSNANKGSFSSTDYFLYYSGDELIHFYQNTTNNIITITTSQNSIQLSGAEYVISYRVEDNFRLIYEDTNDSNIIKAKEYDLALNEIASYTLDSSIKKGAAKIVDDKVYFGWVDPNSTNYYYIFAVDKLTYTNIGSTYQYQGGTFYNFDFYEFNSDALFIVIYASNGTRILISDSNLRYVNKLKSFDFSIASYLKDNYLFLLMQNSADNNYYYLYKISLPSFSIESSVKIYTDTNTSIVASNKFSNIFETKEGLFICRANGSTPVIVTLDTLEVTYFYTTMTIYNIAYYKDKHTPLVIGDHTILFNPPSTNVIDVKIDGVEINNA